jgi:hypothetical protein
MPEISRFYGIVIKMYWNDHFPAHFHAEYGSAEAQVRIEPIGLLRGKLPPRILAMIVEWAALHQQELTEDWERARERRELLPIEGLS